MTYNEFIDNILSTRGRFACGEEYHERHHIVPKCMGGSNDEDNLIDLYAREHFMAHKLLAQENPNNKELIYAWHCMSVVKRYNVDRYELSPEEYEESRIAYSNMISQVMKERLSIPENNPFYNRRHSDEAKRIIGEKSKERLSNPENNPMFGKHQTDESKKKIGEKTKERLSNPENCPMYGKTHTEETRLKISESHIGKTISEEHKQKIREAWTDEKRERASEIRSGEHGVWFGKHFSEEHRAKISKALSGENNPMYGRCGELNPMFGVQRFGKDNPFYGKHHTEETKVKISESKKGRPQSEESNKKRSESERGSNNPRARKVIRLIDFKVYDCLDYAAQDNNMHRDTIWKRCKKHNGFMYYDEFLTQQNNLESNIC